MLKNIIVRIFRCIYYLLYHQFAWTYDYVAAVVSLGRWNSWVQHSLPFLTGQRILEIGFGPGHLLYALLIAHKNVFGVDESQQMTGRAYKKIKILGFTSPIIQGNVFALPYPDGIFNQVVSTFPSEFIFNKIALSEIIRVLQPGGQLVILPFAWIKGKLWVEKMVNHLFDFNSVTHTWEEKYCQVIQHEGFDLTFTQIQDTRSAMLFIIATKPMAKGSHPIEM
jgi:ubiquinone/menaquinone biosynthesis C-methylase UbiE